MLRLFAAICLVLFVPPAFAEGSHTIALTIIPLEPFKAGKPQQAVAKLTHIKDGSPVLFSELAVTHTKQFHLLIIDETLTDFQHVHPLAFLGHLDCPAPLTCNGGEYPFTWTPAQDGILYRAWADITPIATGRQEYAMADIMPPHLIRYEPPMHSPSNTAQIGNYGFTLSFDTQPVAGAAAIGHLKMQPSDGKPLEPVLGAFAHIVGFSADFKTVLHAHPMGDEPANDAARAAPTIDFHIVPPKAGFYKIFVQLKIAGKAIFVPFGIDVAPSKPDKKPV